MSQQNSKKSKQNNEDWTKLLASAILTKSKEPTGDGWKTNQEIADLKKCSRNHAGCLMRKLKNIGAVECFHGTKLINGLIRSTIWYRPTQKGTK